MSTADQVLGALFVAAMVCILGLCWSLQQAHYRLDELEHDVDEILDQPWPAVTQIEDGGNYLLGTDQALTADDAEHMTSELREQFPNATFGTAAGMVCACRTTVEGDKTHHHVSAACPIHSHPPKAVAR